MKRAFLATLVIIFVMALCAGLALAGPKVAIVKSDNDIVSKDYKFDIKFIHPYDFDKPIKEIQYMHAEWGPESQAAIEKMVREAIKLAGDWPVQPGNTVFIKPNLTIDIMNRIYGKKMKPEELRCVCTDPRVVRAVALVALESGAKKVMFGDLPAHGDTMATAKHWGYEVITKELSVKYPGKVELVDLKLGPYKYYKPKRTGGLALKEYAIPELLVKTDIIISAPIMKTHSMAGVTLSLKNIGIGSATPSVYGQFKMGLPHQRLPEVIVDIVDIVGIDYVVMDALVAMEGNGPIDGKPVNMNTIIAGKDPVAVDWVATECMGMKGDSIGVTRLAAKYGIGTYKDVEVVGTPIVQAMRKFEPVPEAARFPGVYGRNVGWGEGAPQ